MSRKRTNDDDSSGNSSKRQKPEGNEMSLQTKRRFQTNNDFRRFDRQFPNFKEPDEIGHFSMDISRNFYCDKSRLRYYIPPSNASNVHFDLRKGYSTMKRIDDDEWKPEFLNSILTWINLNRDKIPSSSDSQGNRYVE